MQWVKLPPKIYFEKNSLQYLRDMKEMEKAMIITDRGMYNLGYVQRVEDVILRRRNKVDITLFMDVEPDPSFDTVEKGLALMQSYQPDVIIALGGGSAMDAAKESATFSSRNRKSKDSGVIRSDFAKPESSSRSWFIYSISSVRLDQ